MPIAYRIIKSSGLTLVVWDGEVTVDDFSDHIDKLRSDPDWPPGTRHLGDLTGATTVPSVATPEIVEKFSAASAWPTVRYALVARAGWEQASAFRQAVSAVGAAPMVVFNDVPNACTWLGLDGAGVQADINDLRSQLRAGPN